MQVCADVVLQSNNAGETHAKKKQRHLKIRLQAAKILVDVKTSYRPIARPPEIPRHAEDLSWTTWCSRDKIGEQLFNSF